MQKEVNQNNSSSDTRFFGCIFVPLLQEIEMTKEMRDNLELHLIRFANEYEMPLVPLLNQYEIAQCIETYNPTRDLPHLTVVTAKGITIEEDAFSIVLDSMDP